MDSGTSAIDQSLFSITKLPDKTIGVRRLFFSSFDYFAMTGHVMILRNQLRTRASRANADSEAGTYAAR